MDPQIKEMIMKLDYNFEAVENAVAILNEALTQDRRAIQELLTKYECCNKNLADNDTIPVVPADENEIGLGTTVRPLGLLNGIMGTLPDGSGPICAVFDDNGNLVQFLNRGTKNE
jgi:hypothetical protein